MGMFGTAVADHTVRYAYRGPRIAVQKTQALVHCYGPDAVCGEKNHHTVGTFGVILSFFSLRRRECGPKHAICHLLLKETTIKETISILQ